MFGKIGGFFKSLGGKIWGGAKALPGIVLRHGPLVASALVGLSTIWPAGGAVLNLVAGMLNGGAAPAGTDAAKSFGELAAAVLLLIGAIRKVLSIIQAQKNA